ncbi:MAG: glycosyltransferase [Candidatus Glassbacteria bacterium]
MTAGNEKVESPLVTVLLSVYNGERFLRESVESILGQTFTDFEFLIVDDASTDSTAQILTEYASRDRRIRLVRNPANVGLTRSLNRGLALAAGKYVARQDADDVSLPERLQRQVEFFAGNPGTALLGGGLELIGERGETLGRRLPPTDHQSLIAELLIKNNAIGHSCAMLALSAVRELGGYDESFPYAQDYDLWWRISRRWKIANLPEVLVRWRSTGTSISSSRRQEQLSCMYRTSVAAVSETIGPGLLDNQAYCRFWHAYHGEVEGLRQGDLQCLKPLWDYISTLNGDMEATREGMKNLYYGLLRCGNRAEACELRRVIVDSFHGDISFWKAVKNRLRGLIGA